MRIEEKKKEMTRGAIGTWLQEPGPGLDAAMRASGWYHPVPGSAVPFLLGALSEACWGCRGVGTVPLPPLPTVGSVETHCGRSTLADEEFVGDIQALKELLNHVQNLCRVSS